MIRYYFHVAFRHLARNKGFTFINVVGLSLGIVSAVLILQYVFFEQSYDSFHEKKERTYRVTSSRYSEGVKQYEKAKAFIPLGKALEDEFPEVESYVTIFPIFSETDIYISYQNEGGEAKVFREKDVFHVRGNVFEVFDFNFLKGSHSAGAPEPGTVYISAAMAEKYFGEEDPLGKVLKHNLFGDYKVGGVFADWPANSHIHFNFIYPWEPLSPHDDTHWRWDGFLTYLVLSAETDAAAFNQKLAGFSDKMNAQEVHGKLEYTYNLQPIQDIHLHSKLVGEVEPNGNVNIIYILLGLAVFVLLIVWVNYVNLTSAKLLERGREVAVRKINGSGKKQLVLQLLTESLLLNLFAAIIALLLIAIILPFYSKFTGMPAGPEVFTQTAFWLPFLAVILGGSLATAIYPALMLSSFEPLQALKGKTGSGMNAFPAFMRSSLVVFQLVISLSLLMGSLVAYQQMNYMNELDAKVDKEHVLVVRTLERPSPPGADSLFVRKIEALKSSLKSHAFIKGATLGSGVPGLENPLKASLFRRSLDDENTLTMEISRVDYDFAAIFKPRFIAGRPFTREFGSDKKACLINLEALKQLGYKDAEEALRSGLIMGTNNEKREVIGIIDYQSMASRQEAVPAIFVMDFGPGHYVSIKVAGDSQQNISGILDEVKGSWAALFPDKPFDFFFLDDFFASQYQAELKLQQSIFLFTSLAIALACLGLLGLTSFTYKRRMKEMGVRKVLGSSVQQLVGLLLKSYVKLLLIAGLIFPPVICYFVNNWLEHYPARIQITWWYYALPFALMLIIPIVCIFYHTLRTALVNPVNLLRDE